MYGFMYALEGVRKKPGVGEWAALGLGHVFGGLGAPSARIRNVNAGPWGPGEGLVVMAGESVPEGLFGYGAGTCWERFPESFVSQGDTGNSRGEEEEGSTTKGTKGHEGHKGGRGEAGEEMGRGEEGRGERAGEKRGRGEEEEGGGEGKRGEEGKKGEEEGKEGKKVAGSVWLGWVEGAKPGPVLLARERQVEGHGVVLGDGNRWLVPVARRVERVLNGEVEGGCALPVKVGLDPVTGLYLSGTIVGEYRELWAMAEAYWGRLCGGDVWEEDGEPVVRFTFDVANELAVRALGVNYLVGPVECVALGLLDGEAWVGVLNAVVDLPGWNALVKKNIVGSRG